jgi:hypothetical protein
MALLSRKLGALEEAVPNTYGNVKKVRIGRFAH